MRYLKVAIVVVGIVVGIPLAVAYQWPAILLAGILLLAAFTSTKGNAS